MPETFRPIFPEVSGTEEETRVSFRAKAFKPLISLTDGSRIDGLLACINDYCPRLQGTEFFENGSRFYNDGYCVELASPECADPYEHVAYTQANDTLMTRGLEQYAGILSDDLKTPVEVIQQRRVIDQGSNTWGNHDNFSLRTTRVSRALEDENNPLSRLLVAYLMTRPFIVGSGLVENGLVSFSQKLSVIHAYSHYGFNTPSLLRTDPLHGNRLEIRCNDINLLEWASLARIGGIALFLSLRPKDIALLEKQLGEVPTLDDRREFNEVPLDESGQLHLSDPLVESLRFQRTVTTHILDALMRRDGDPRVEQYVSIGKNILDFCDDFEAVAAGAQPLSTLANRADWAAKFSAIQRSIVARPKHFFGDEKSIAYDFAYDRKSITADKDVINTTYGYGYALAQKQNNLDLHSLLTATRKPPERTRAFDRVRIAQSVDELESCFWNIVIYRDGDGNKRQKDLDSLRRTDSAIDVRMTL